MTMIVFLEAILIGGLETVSNMGSSLREYYADFDSGIYGTRGFGCDLYWLFR